MTELATEAGRFVVRSVTGYSITPSGSTSGGPATIYSVLDSAVCYRQVYETNSMGGGKANAEARAHTIAAGLNEGKTPRFNSRGTFLGWRAPERPRSPYPHGTLSAYSNDRCRCELCKDARRVYELDYQARKRASA